MIKLTPSLQRNIDTQRAKLYHAVEVFAAGPATLAEAGLNSIHTRAFGYTLQKLPGSNHKPKKYRLNASVAACHEMIEQHINAVTLQVYATYQRNLQQQKTSQLVPVAVEQKPQPTPGFRLIELENTRRWARSNAFNHQRCHGSLGGNSIAYYG